MKEEKMVERVQERRRRIRKRRKRLRKRRGGEAVEQG